MSALIQRVKRRLGLAAAPDADDDPHAALISRARRKRRMQNLLLTHLTKLRILMLLVGYCWLAALPSSPFGVMTRTDESALGAGQVNTRWNWDDVHAADRYLETLNGMRGRNASRAELAQWTRDELEKLGLPAATQRYKFETSTGTINGTNTYAVFSAPRTSGAEAMVIAASWHTRLDDGAGALNERGIPMVLSLARFLSKYSHWSKDIVFVISDNYLDGMQAWLSAYHGTSQPNLVAEPLSLTSGVIWTALAIDYPGHSFSHLGLFFDGLNGRLPNQDLLNSVQVISQWTGGIPVVLYDHIEAQFSSTKKPTEFDTAREIHTYKTRARNMLRHIGYEVMGSPSGIHGMFHQFRIDALTVFAVPATGPHGFHSLGRTVESTLRTMSNLLERLHASFFFYLMASPTQFLQIGQYLPPAIILSIAITVTGLAAWNTAGYTEFDPQDAARQAQEAASQLQEKLGHGEKAAVVTAVTAATFKPGKRKRPVMPILTVMFGAHVVGLLVLASLRVPAVVANLNVIFLPLAAAFAVLVLIAPKSSSSLASARHAPTNLVLYAFTLLEAGMFISLFAVLNFALASTLAVILALPLVALSPRAPRILRVLLAGLVVAPVVLARPEVLARKVWEWEVLGAWAVPVACCVYLPVVLQMWVSAVLYF